MGWLRNAVLVGEEVVRLGRGVSVVPIKTPVCIVAAALELHVDGSAPGQPLFGVVGIRRDVHVLDRFNGRDEGLRAGAPEIQSVHAFDADSPGAGSRAIERERHGFRRIIGSARELPGGGRCAGNQLE